MFSESCSSDMEFELSTMKSRSTLSTLVTLMRRETPEIVQGFSGRRSRSKQPVVPTARVTSKA